jgi:cell division protein FtsQ
MKAYNELVQQLDSSGAHYSQDLSEVDLSDLENLRVRVNDPAGDVLVELGNSDYLKRYKIFVSHVQEWRQQFQKLESVNLRYDNQVIVNPDLEGRPKQAALTAAAAKAAAAAGVKPAALVAHMNPHDRTLPKPAFELTEKKLDLNAAVAKKPLSKTRLKKASVKPAKSAPVKKVIAKRQAVAAKPKPAALHAVPLQKKTGTKKPTQSTVVAHSTIPKPSAAIAKPSAATGSD